VCNIVDDHVRVRLPYPSVYINAAIVSVRYRFFTYKVYDDDDDDDDDMQAAVTSIRDVYVIFSVDA